MTTGTLLVARDRRLVSDGNWDKLVADKAAGCDGNNVSIALVWKDPPAGTRSYMLPTYDPDALDGSMGW